ncbi:MAG: hypothetical protein ACT4O0_19285 [Pseudonocardia sp.]
MLTEPERRALREIAEHLRADDERFARCLQTFRLEFPPAAPTRPARAGLLRRTARRLAAVALVAAAMVLWVVALRADGIVALLSALLVLQASAILLFCALAVLPGSRVRRLRSGRSSPGWWRSGRVRSARLRTGLLTPTRTSGPGR